MSNPYIWAGLQRANNDPTTIDEAIGEAITAHNDDPDAHLGADQALESHRASEIIDHRAESVVNDKIATIARAYVAIVDPSSSVDFDTIQEAITYATGKNGGTIYLAPGDHYISGVVDLPMSINFVAADAESCRIHANKTAGDYLNITDDTATGQLNQTFDNISFVSGAGAVIYSSATDLTNVSTQYFTRCTFNGGGVYRDTTNIEARYTDCTFYCGNVAAVRVDKIQRLYTCYIYRYGTASAPIFASFHDNDYYDCAIWAHECTFDCASATTARYFDSTWDFSINLFQSTLYAWDYQNAALFTMNLQNCYITGKTNRVYTLSSDGNEGVIAFNTIRATGTGYILPTGPPLKFIGNIMIGAATHASSDVTIIDDMSVDAWTVYANAQTALKLADYWVSQLTPTTTRTVTTNVPRAGERRTLIILTSGSTSYVITFGTGFKTTGTLTTGTTSARYFVLQFVSNGISLIETSRTIAIA